MTTSVVTSEKFETIEGRLDSAIGQAHDACSLDSRSPQCATAWDIVEELQAEISHRRQARKAPTPFEQYCETNPDADECRIYDV